MARNPTQLLPAPRGMDGTTDAVHLPIDIAQGLNNVLFDRPGILRAQVRLLDLLTPASVPSPINTILGLGYYNGPFTAADRLLYAANGKIYEAAHAGAIQSFFTTGNDFVPPYPPAFANAVLVGGYGGRFSVITNNEVGRVRMAQYGVEMLIVEEYGIQPQRYVGNSTNAFFVGYIRVAGLFTPAVAPTLADGGAGGKGAGTFRYLYTTEDEFGRESSPSPSVAITLAASHETDITILGANLPTVGVAPSLNIYATLAGLSSPYYRITHMANPGFGTNATYTDSATDASVSTGVLAPLPGQNDPPNQASLVAIWNNYVFYDDTENIGYLQISNANSATQFNQLLDPATPSLGGRILVAQDQSDVIMSLVPFFSRLVILKRKSAAMLFGDDVRDFTVRQLQIRGCIAKDSAVRCDNVIFYLSEDGVYALDGSGATEKVSKPIEASLAPFALNPTGRRLLETSVATYDKRCYRLSVGTYTYVYNFDAQAWGMEGYGLPPYGTDIAEAVLPNGGAGVPGAGYTVVPPQIDNSTDNPPPLQSGTVGINPGGGGSSGGGVYPIGDGGVPPGQPIPGQLMPGQLENRDDLGLS